MPLGGLPPLESLDGEALRRLIVQLESLEDDVSLRRRELHARIDMIRAAS
jgi:hypothetical protein